MGGVMDAGVRRASVPKLRLSTLVDKVIEGCPSLLSSAFIQHARMFITEVRQHDECDLFRSGGGLPKLKLDSFYSRDFSQLVSVGCECLWIFILRFVSARFNSAVDSQFGLAQT